MTINLTAKERAFIKGGGQLWCVRECKGGWEAVKLRADGESIVGTRMSRDEANMDALSLANLSGDQSLLAVHHDIPRPEDWPADYLVAK